MVIIAVVVFVVVVSVVIIFGVVVLVVIVFVVVVFVVIALLNSKFYECGLQSKFPIPYHFKISRQKITNKNCYDL